MNDDAPFDALAGDYARYRIGYAPELYEILERSGVGAGARVLDLACGTGLVTAELARRGASVTGLDIAERMLHEAAARVPAATFVRGTAEAMPFAAGAFDAVVCGQAFHWFDAPRALAECVRVARPGGLVAVWWKGLTRGDVFRGVRDDAARSLGVEVVPDLLAAGFAAFERPDLHERELHVVPWNVERTDAELLGYERSRARSRAAYSERLEDYLSELERRLADHPEPYVLSYVHYLYLARTAAAG